MKGKPRLLRYILLFEHVYQGGGGGGGGGGGNTRRKTIFELTNWLFLRGLLKNTHIIVK